MEAHKLERIRNLEREVQDFHPILKILLSKIPYIQNVEYRQGPNENGADFVLEKTDDILNTTTYIGVIVKIGKIKLDHSDIQRQIEECGMERTFNNGKKKIFISEIWVINNDSITDNAQQKIHHNHKNTNIQFFDGTKVSALIERFYPEYWTDISIKLGEYFRKTKIFTEKITKNSALIEFQENINIEQKIFKLNSKIKADQGRPNRNKYTTIHDAIKSERLIFLEGFMGAGKSNLIKRAIEQISRPESISIEKIIPIALTFKDYYETHKQDLETIVNLAITDSNTDPAKYTYIIILDGLDEIPLTPEEKKLALLKLSAFIRESENIKALVTSRTIEDLKEKNELDKHFSRYEVCPLSTRQLISFIEKTCDNPAAIERLTSGIERSPLFKTLPKTPISAILLARILKEDPAELPSTMTELYSKYSELVLGRWDMSKGLQSQKEYEIIDNVCTDLGEYIISNSLEEISAKEVKGFFETYIKERNLKISSELIFEKFLAKKEIINYSNKNLTINFKHRTFAEYFSARKLSRDNSAVIDARVFEPYWCTVFFFYIGIKRDCPELIDAIINIETENPQEQITRIFQTAQYLLAGYLTPYKNIKQALQNTYHRAAILLHESLNGNTPLSALPKMQLIYILSHGICSAYGYDYFKDAIQETMLDKLEHNNLSESDLIEFFLLSTTSAFLGNNEAFEELINEYGQSLPEHLQLGIQHINNDFSLKSDITTKFIKKMHKKFKSRNNIQELIKQLYETPINKPAL